MTPEQIREGKEMMNTNMVGDYDDYDPDECPVCGGEGTGESACPDDLCHGGDVPCMHGDYWMIRCHCCGQ